MKKEIWPNFLIVGAAKAGTTSLYTYLNDIPQIYMSPHKEPHYFAPNVKRQPYLLPVRQRSDYVRLFTRARKNHQAIGEASPSYLWDKETPEIISRTIPNVKIIIMLRDPISRAYSHYLHHLRYGWERDDFYSAVKRDYQRYEGEDEWSIPDLYVYPGFYSKQVKRYLNLFDTSNIRFVLFEKFVQDTASEVAEVVRFLGVESTVPDSVGEIYNPFLVPRNRMATGIIRSLFRVSHWSRLSYRLTHMLPEKSTSDGTVQNIAYKLFLKPGKKPTPPPIAEQFLRDLYYNDVLDLEKLLGITLPWKTVKGHYPD